MNSTVFSENMKKFRLAKKYTQEYVADMMDVSIQMISNLERGNKSIRIENLIKLCQILDVSTDYILTGNEKHLDNAALTENISHLSPKAKKMIAVLVEHCISDNI